MNQVTAENGSVRLMLKKALFGQVGEDVLEQQGHCFDESGKH